MFTLLFSACFAAGKGQIVTVENGVVSPAGVLATSGEVARKLDITATNGWETGSHSALATNRVTRLETQDGSFWLDATGVLWRVEQSFMPDTTRLIVSSGVASAENYEIHPGDVFTGVVGTNSWECQGWIIRLVGSDWYIRDDQGMWYAAVTPVYPSGPEGQWTAVGGNEINFTLSYGVTTNIVSVTSRVDSVAFQSDLDALPMTDVSGLATTQYVAAAVAAIPVPDMSGRVSVSGGTATNLTVHGLLAMPQSSATNLVGRIFTSNDVIYVEWINQ